MSFQPTLESVARVLSVTSGPLALLLAMASAGTAVAAPDHHDLIIRQARIIDGTGAAWFRGDVAVTSGVITRVGKINPEDTATSVILAQDRYLSPGFIDVHTHCEGQFQDEPEAQNFARMGVTTVITGNCGSSSFPVGKALDSITSSGPGINVATLVGHGTVRRRVMENVNRDPSTTEVETMQGMVREAMADGAFGLATGLIYTPGLYSKTPELVELAKPAAEAGGIYVSHMRNEGMTIENAINEAITIAKTNRMPLQISHFKLTAPKRHGETSVTIGMVEKARAEGLDVTVDQYLYTASSTGIRSMLPDWVTEGNTTDVLNRIAAPGNRDRIIKELVESRRAQGRKDLSTVNITNFSADRSINGMDIAAIAVKWGRGETFEAQAGVVVDIVTSGGAGIVSHSMDEKDVQSIARYPNTMFASDSGIRTFGSGVPHPRGYGNNARALSRYARDMKLFTVEECVRKMTSLPARTFRLTDRGIIRPGMAADLVVFDLDRVNDPSTFAKPHAYAEGFDEVWVNGRPLITGGQLTGERSGKVLRGPGYNPSQGSIEIGG